MPWTQTLKQQKRKPRLPPLDYFKTQWPHVVAIPCTERYKFLIRALSEIDWCKGSRERIVDMIETVRSARHHLDVPLIMAILDYIDERSVEYGVLELHFHDDPDGFFHIGFRDQDEAFWFKMKFL